MTPDDLLRVVQAAFRVAPPNRHTSLLRTVERAFWGSRTHPAAPHCPICGATGEAGKKLVVELGQHCDACLRIAYGVLVELRVGQAPPSWEMAAAETARAIRASSVADGEDAIEALEARLFSPPESHACARCGSAGRWPRADSDADTCGVCRRTRGEAGALVAGPATGLCHQCIDAGHRFLLRPR